MSRIDDVPQDVDCNCPGFCTGNHNFKEAVIDALVVNHIYQKEHETNALKAIADLVSWEVKVALDPAVSSDAQKLCEAAERDAKLKIVAYMRTLIQVYGPEMSAAWLVDQVHRNIG